jgi:hypothetical protein
VKKVLLTLGLVAGMVANAQMAIISGSNHKVYRVTRLNFDSVEVKHLEMGNVKSTDTMTVGDFITLTGGYSIMSGNITNPKPVAPKIDEHKHKPLSEEQLAKFYVAKVVGFTVGLTYLTYKFIKWVNAPIPISPPSIYNPGTIGGQCSATAASTGQRCKRSRESGSAYCWQHN